MGRNIPIKAVRTFGRPEELNRLASRDREGPKIAAPAKIHNSDNAKATQNGVKEGRRLRLEAMMAPPGSFSLAGTPRTAMRAPANASCDAASVCRSASRRLHRRILGGCPVCLAINYPPAASFV